VCVCGVIYQATPIEFNTIDIASLEGIGVVTAPRVHFGDSGDVTDTMLAWLRVNNKLGRRAPDGGPGTGGPTGRGLAW